MFTFVIPAYNEEEWIGRCVRNIRESAEDCKISYEIIVVDNQSTDRTRVVAENTGADVVEEPERQIARARNRGARAASGRFLIFVDADTMVSPRLIARTAERLRSGGVVGGGALVRSDQSDATMKFGLRIWNTISRRFRLAAGSFLFARRDVFDSVGGFNENLYASEELDLSMRLKRRGRRLGLSFEIIEECVVTSARKTSWYSNGQLLVRFLLVLFMPWAVYYRSLCGFWYDRPEDDLD